MKIDNNKINEIAAAIKEKLVEMAIDDSLPMDMTEFPEYVLAGVIKAQFPDEYTQRLIKAEEILCVDDEDTAELQVQRIEAQAAIDDSVLIDIIDDVWVIENLEYSYTCKGFLEHINS